MLLIIGLVAGVFAGYYINNLIRVFNEGMKLNVLGYEIRINKNKESSVREIKEKKQPISEVKTNKCELCNGEDMFIKGTKNLIPCPECKKNQDKFKGVLA